jgi:uncharacterized protein YjbJ (UPF0337 family)
MEGKILQNNCNNMRDQISEWWDDLSEEDLDMINGDQEELITLLQERYGYSRNIAFLACIEIKIRMKGSPHREKRIASVGI